LGPGWADQPEMLVHPLHCQHIFREAFGVAAGRSLWPGAVYIPHHDQQPARLSAPRPTPLHHADPPVLYTLGTRRAGMVRL
jgi:hypothetical protein